MIQIHNHLKKNNMQSKMILQVHDELVFDAHRDELENLKKIVAGYMQNAVKLSVALETEVNTGENWLEAH